MTISNGSVVDEFDLYQLQAPTLALRDADGALPGCWNLAFSFVGIVASTPDYRRTFTFVIPNDVLVEVIGVSSGVQTAASTATVTLSSDGGALAVFPATVTGTTSTALSRLPRPLYDNTPTNMADSPATTARVMRVLGKGQTATVTVTTTNVNASGVINVTLFGRHFHARS